MKYPKPLLIHILFCLFCFASCAADVDFPALKRELADADAGVRLKAVGKLVALKSQHLTPLRSSVRDALAAATADTDKAVQLAACAAIAAWVEEDEIRPYWSLESLEKKPVAPWIESLASEDVVVRRGAAWALAFMALNEPALRPAVQAAVPGLEKLLKDRAPKARVAAVVALGKIVPAMDANVPLAAAAALVAALKDPDEGVRSEAKKAVARLLQAGPALTRAFAGELRQQGVIDKAEEERLIRGPVAEDYEAAAIASCQSIREAQEVFKRADYDGDGVLEYAQTFRGDHSLMEQKAEEMDLGLIEYRLSAAEGDPGAGLPANNNYRFKILKAQGARAPGGAKPYLANGNLTLGYAVLAYPVDYGEKGRLAILMAHTGVMYTKDLGAETHATVKAMIEFNPDETWVKIKKRRSRP